MIRGHQRKSGDRSKSAGKIITRVLVIYSNYNNLYNINKIMIVKDRNLWRDKTKMN